MGRCKDQSTTYLKQFGYNVIRLPAADIEPLQLMGKYNDAIGVIGRIDQLVDNSIAPAPPIVRDMPAANINGRRTSKLPISIGVNILGNIISALGGDIGVNASFERARTIEFRFDDVKKDKTNLISAGDFLQNGDIRWDQIILEKYLFGKGDLYLITDIIKSRKFTVSAYAKNGAGVDINLPVIEEILSGAIKVSRESERANSVTFEGDTDLSFGFKAVEFSAGEDEETGELTLRFEPKKAGSITFGIGAPAASELPLFAADGAVAALPHETPEALGE